MAKTSIYKGERKIGVLNFDQYIHPDYQNQDLQRVSELEFTSKAKVDRHNVKFLTKTFVPNWTGALRWDLYLKDYSI